MALDSVKLDDLEWQGMVDGIRGRIAAASGNQWTHHAPVDPGITLLEMFAYLLEQRLFWMDQVPDSLVHGFLSLLGDSARQTRSAMTVLKLTNAEEVNQPPKTTAEVKAGTAMQLQEQRNVHFSTQSNVTLLPINRVQLFTNDTDRSTDLQQGRGVELLPADGEAAQFRLVFWYRGSILTHGTLSILLQLDTAQRIPSQWSENAHDDVPPPAELEWLYPSLSGVLAPFHCETNDVIDDGTIGLRRSGIVQLCLPPDWAPDGPSDSSGYFPYTVVVRTAASTFTYAPRLTAVTPNAVIARHWEDTNIPKETLQQQLDNWLPLPAQQLCLPDFESLAIEYSIVLKLRERDDQWYQWQAVQDLSFHQSRDRIFLLDRESGILTFGNGLTGRIPIPADDGALAIELDLALGGGESGNLGSKRSWQGVEDISLKASNPVASEGGHEAETLQDAQRRIAADLQKRNRAVTVADYIELAEATPGIAIERAYTAVGAHPAHPCSKVPGAVSVFVVPHAFRQQSPGHEWDQNYVTTPQPDGGALSAVRAYLDVRRLVTTELYVRKPVYRAVNLSITIVADPDDPNVLRQRIHDRLAAFLDPLIGGEEKLGWPFGQPLRPSTLLRQIEDLIGDEGEVERVAIGLDDNPRLEDCNDTVINAHELVYLGKLKVILQQQALQIGSLR